MRRSLVAVSSIAMIAAVALTASAQGRRGGMFFGGPGGGLFMLRNPAVQAELKMTDDQKAKLATEQQNVRSQMQDLRQSSGGFQNMTPEDRQKFFQKMQAIQEKAVADVLDPTQMVRYHQLTLQQAGAQALTRPDVQDQLKMTDEQKKSVQDIQQKSMEEVRAAMQGVDFQNMTPDDRQKLGAKMRAMRSETNNKMLAVLTDDQKAQWKTMLGTPFNFPARQPRRPPGGAPQGQ
ncbi:MAG TPA: hypothetical protein VGS41_13570 [Chthonomonadales bacterium]|nr:hypothetical protein [Chthonomonadales bacterium]